MQLTLAILNWFRALVKENGDDPRRPEARLTLGRRLKKERIEWRPQSRYFIPVDILDKLLTPEAIRAELRETFKRKKDKNMIADYERTISESAKWLYALLLYEEKGRLIGKFLDEGLGDEDLPFERVHRMARSPLDESQTDSDLLVCKSSHKNCIKLNHEGCEIRALSLWEQEDITDLCHHQWIFQAPVLEATNDVRIPHLELHDTAVLPYVYDQCGVSQAGGGYSEVWGVQVHPAHQKLYTSPNPQVTQPLLAVKRLISRAPTVFEKEVNMLKHLAMTNHPHLIKLLATYKFQGSYDMMFPFANANLREYWVETGKPYWNKDTCMWFLNQIIGLTSGLNALHNFEVESNIGPSAADKQEDKFGRHGDIKPENILWSNEFVSGTLWGILQIADMGLGKFHGVDSRSKDDPRTVPISETYAAPEIPLGKPVSRAYDIWSLGCVFLEFITWLLEGSAHLEKFSTARMQVIGCVEDDVFYTVETQDSGFKSAEVREGVKLWIRNLQDHPQCSGMIRDLLQVIQRQMLVINSRYRISVKDLNKRLQGIRSSAEISIFYLLGQNEAPLNPVTGVKLPNASESATGRGLPHLVPEVGET